MQDRDVTKRRFEALHFILFVVPTVIVVIVMFLYFVEVFTKMGLLSYFFTVLTVVGIILFVYDHFNGKSK